MGNSLALSDWYIIKCLIIRLGTLPLNVDTVIKWLTSKFMHPVIKVEGC